MSHRSQTIAKLFFFLLISCVSTTRAVDSTSYSFSQENVDSSDTTVPYSGSGSDFGAVTETPTHSTLQFDAIAESQSTTAGSFSMKSRSGIDAVINAPADMMIEQFEMLTSQVTSETTITDTVQITGPAGSTSGTILFFWTLTGESQMSATESSDHNVLLDGMSASMTMSVDTPITPATEQTVDLDFAPPLGINNSSKSTSSGAIPGPVVLPVPFAPGSTIDVEFTLKTEANLNIDPVDTLGFQFDGDSSARYENTAILNGIMLIDTMDNPIEGGVSSTIGKGAYTTIAAVPEPSAFALLLLVSVALGGKPIIRRWRAA